MSNKKELVLFCRADGKWAVYDDTYDITIHCESQQEQDETMELLRKANQDACEVMSLKEMARRLMGACRYYLDTGLETENGCPGCPFDKPTSNDGDGGCRLGVPFDWGI